ncbi:hypothetical protein AMAG_20324 [Allomyces macrogynus ATCC 38327]|uniref:Uncharacterized protein n=1 Tax=Allomyces macrogynus (strain ATCC 38327) TaxID=578462 RepID=A0A0L0T981_ALLM3|nr:hypothetical protein AMAG_20324 [Allomyces macrogynus ATCC 38327]|eukprot:KNE71275.1 hypothetical protein AMAG_20324 [Allomyces macrogynus ATCC 38327]
MTRAEWLLYVTWLERRKRYGGGEATIRSSFLACLDGAIFPKTKKLLLTTTSPTVDKPLLEFFTKVRQHQAEQYASPFYFLNCPFTGTDPFVSPARPPPPDRNPALPPPPTPSTGGGFTSAAVLPRTAAPATPAPAKGRGKKKAAAPRR